MVPGQGHLCRIDTFLVYTILLVRYVCLSVSQSSTSTPAILLLWRYYVGREIRKDYALGAGGGDNGFDHSKAVVSMFILLFVALWFILPGDSF